MNFYFDENLSDRLASGLNEFDDQNSFKHFNEIDFGGLRDIEWFTRLPKNEKNIVITLDRKISRNLDERLAWKESRAILFFLANKSFSNLQPWDRIVKIVRKWPQICDSARKAYPGDGFKIRVTGNKIEPMEDNRRYG